MHGKVCLVTGATSGIGEVTAEELARRGATVVIAGRNPQRCALVAARIRGRTGNPSVDYLVADLSSQAEIRELARQFAARSSRLDVLVNNAGGVFLKRRLSADGMEMTFALNHLGYFLLTNLLIDLLKASAPARVVNVASCGHEIPRGIDFADLQATDRYRGFQAYHRSKLANVLFTYELARRLESTGVTANALHPGMVRTHIGENNGFVFRALKYVFDRVYRIKYISPEEGAGTVVYLAASPEVEGVTGLYFVDSKPKESSAASRDPEAAARLWELSEEMTGLVTNSRSYSR